MAFVGIVTAFLLRRAPHVQGACAGRREACRASFGAVGGPTRCCWTTGVQVLRVLGGGRTFPLTIAAALAGFALSGAGRSGARRRRQPASQAKR
jgi:hypothetical protein